MNLEDRQTAQHSVNELGRSEPADRFIPLVYNELRALAQSWYTRGFLTGTLQPTALVHEAYIRLVTSNGRYWQDCTHFRAVAAQAMRQILIDHARSRRAAKRGGDRHRVTLCETLPAAAESPVVDMLDLDEALTELSTLNARQSTITELRFLGGLTVEEVAKLVGVSERTVGLEWKMARAWLLCKLESKE